MDGKIGTVKDQYLGIQDRINRCWGGVGHLVAGKFSERSIHGFVIVK
jgi:hypothetical protein